MDKQKSASDSTKKIDNIQNHPKYFPPAKYTNCLHEGEQQIWSVRWTKMPGLTRRVSWQVCASGAFIDHNDCGVGGS